MSLPPTFLSQVEHHSCFSGCYGSELDARVCLDPAQPSQPGVFISCRDCLTYKVGVLRSLLAPGISSDLLAEQVTQHLRQVRGFEHSFGGYHMRGGGFWLNAVYYSCGLFLVDGARSRSMGSDLDLLLLSFKHGVAHPADPRMDDPQLYTTQVVYVDFSVPVKPIGSKQDLLSSPQVRMSPASGFHRVTLAEFLPVSSQVSLMSPPLSMAQNQAAQVSQAGAGASTQGLVASSGVPSNVPSNVPSGQQGSGAAPIPHRPRRPLQPGEICPVCKSEYRERALFSSSYMGCLC